MRSRSLGYFQSGNDQPHAIVGKRTSPEQADGVFIDDNLHFVDARFKEKHFPGESRGAQISRLTMASSARFIAPSTVWAMETR